ncbi:ATP-binding cassette domain-containing protein [Halorubrum trueperi]|uniref:Cobalamin import ATP-binding protein BtuD n=1 Tax=Halorubrum trueperi TaxID=2004704 RepID=A0ABD5UFD8_9EURY
MDGEAEEVVDAAGDGVDPLIAVDDLSASFGDVPVVSGVDLRVGRGELVGLVGPNGAGKTTVLRAITGTVDPDAGEVRLDGDAAADLSARETGRRVASVPQDTGLAFDFRVRHVVEMGRTPHLGRFDGHGADDERAVREAMDAANVARFADRSIAAVSGGERQRVLLARALAQGTSTLLLDEPTASLDVNHAVQTLELVRDIVDDGRGALAAIHDLDMAARYCDVVVVIANGGVHAAGPPEEVLTRDALRAAFAAEAFVGRNPATGSPTVTTFDAADSGTDRDSRRVHVVGRGRGAARVVARLAAAGHELSVGVVPEGDATAAVAADAGATVVTAPPFEAVDPEQRDAAVDFATRADVTVAVDGGARGGSGTVDDPTPADDLNAADDPNAAVRDVPTPIVSVDGDADEETLLTAVRESGGA